MDTKYSYRGRKITGEDIAFIRNLIAENPVDSRRRISQKLCQAWNWVQANGELRDMVCRSLLLQLERTGHIRLPEKKLHPQNPLALRNRPQLPSINETPVTGNLNDLDEPLLVQVRRTPMEKLFNGLLEHYHYLGYTQPVGEHLKYLVLSGDQPIACFSWSSAPRHIGCRDRFIGWSQERRRERIHFIAYNSRFLILPWVCVHGLASHLLGRMARTISNHWQHMYGHGLYFLETFVDTQRFRGTCYRAANWVYLGKTTGRGKNDQTHKPNRSIKDAWGYPLVKDFRKKLCQ